MSNPISRRQVLATGAVAAAAAASSCGGAARHHGRFCSHQRGQTIPDRFLKFLQDDILSGRFRLCLEKLGPLLGSSNRRMRPLKVDERPQAEFLVNGLFRPRGRGRGRRESAQRTSPSALEPSASCCKHEKPPVSTPSIIGKFRAHGEKFRGKLDLAHSRRPLCPTPSPVAT